MPPTLHPTLCKFAHHWLVIISACVTVKPIMSEAEAESQVMIASLVLDLIRVSLSNPAGTQESKEESGGSQLQCVLHVWTGPDPGVQRSRCLGKCFLSHWVWAVFYVLNVYCAAFIQLLQAFTIMDQNRDGFIDKNDLRDTFAALGRIYRNNHKVWDCHFGFRLVFSFYWAVN